MWSLLARATTALLLRPTWPAKVSLGVFRGFPVGWSLVSLSRTSVSLSL
jgi:hypothetical protein